MKIYMNPHLYHKNIYVKEKIAYKRIYIICHNFIKMVNCVYTRISMKKYTERYKLQH